MRGAIEWQFLLALPRARPFIFKLDLDSSSPVGPSADRLCRARIRTNGEPNG